jgi:hypothetical protein
VGAVRAGPSKRTLTAPDEGRIHFCINYPELGTVSRRTIWKMFLDRVSAKVAEEDLNRLAAQELNGRQVSQDARHTAFVRTYPLVA